MILRWRWPLLILYLAVVTLLLWAYIDPREFESLVLLLAVLVCQAFLFLGRGDLTSLRPVTIHGVLAPVVIGALMLATLTLGSVLALVELFRIPEPAIFPSGSLMYLLFAGSWLGWFAVFAVATSRAPTRLHALRRVILAVLAGSLIELLVAGTAHMVVRRRPGCFVGLSTGIGVGAGVTVMVWAFGPAIMLLFLQAWRSRLSSKCQTCGYDLRGLPEPRCPECGRPFRPQDIRRAP